MDNSKAVGWKVKEVKYKHRDIRVSTANPNEDHSYNATKGISSTGTRIGGNSSQLHANQSQSMLKVIVDDDTYCAWELWITRRGDWQQGCRDDWDTSIWESWNKVFHCITDGPSLDRIDQAVGTGSRITLCFWGRWLSFVELPNKI